MTSVTDVVVIGGGQSGLAAARTLQTHGISPVVLEVGPETGRLMAALLRQPGPVLRCSRAQCPSCCWPLTASGRSQKAVALRSGGRREARCETLDAVAELGQC